MSIRESGSPAIQRAQPPLSRRIRRISTIDPDAPALSFGATTFGWSFIRDAIRDLDAQLEQTPGAHRIGIVLRNRPGPYAAVAATLGTGREVVTLSPHLGDVGLADDIVQLAPDVIIAEDEDWARPALSEAAAKIAAVPLRTGTDRALTAFAGDWDPSPRCAPPGPIAVLMMTSGTTGRPKRVELTYARMIAAFRAAGTPVYPDVEAHLRHRPAILWASLAHISGMYFAVAHVLEGRCVALMEKFDVEVWAHLVRNHRPGFVRLAPTALRMVLQADLPNDTFRSIRAVGSGTAPLPPELAEEFEDRYGIPVLGTYGATEFAGAIAGWTLPEKREWGSRKRGSVGRPHHGVELRIVDADTHRPLPPGETGLLEARGGQLPGDHDSWIRTTDLASLDADGFLYIHGRADDAINRGGFKIPPTVIEDALHGHPAVDEAVAVGLPDERLGEVPVVAVTLDGAATEEELMDYLSSVLTRYQRPVRLRIVDTLPRTPSLKVSRSMVRDEFFLGDAPAVT